MKAPLLADQMRIALFILLTWGIILGLPVLAFFGLRSQYPHINWLVPGLLSLLLLCSGILLAEWLARLVNWLIEGILPSIRESNRHDT